MVVEERESNGYGVCTMGAKSEATDGSSPETENGIGDDTSAGSAGEGLRMYSRRKRRKMTTQLFPDGIVSMDDSSSKLTDKVIKEPPNEVLDNSSSELGRRDRLGSDAFVNGSDGCSPRHCRKLVLEQMYQSLNESEGGLRECIRKALVTHSESSCTTAVKDSRNCVEEEHHCPSKAKWIFSGTQSTTNGHAGVTRNGLLNESDHFTKTELCKRAFFDVLISEKFSQLCDLLFKSFHDVKVDRILDVNVINSRMKDGAYESSPMLFLSDIQQVWTKLQKVGSEMGSLAKILSDKSRTCCEQVGGFAHSTSEDDKHEPGMQEPEMLTKPKETEACVTYRVCTCRQCGETADQRNCLVCDSCEEMYHLSCIQPAVTEIPLKSWYCANCILKGIEPPHENCVVCERLKATPTSQIDEEHENEEIEDGLQEHEAGLSNGGESLSHCPICRSRVKTGEKFRTCGHRFCLHKHFHDRCLTSKQLGTYGAYWLCPSCLCRNCLTDKDDDKIVLCETCDQAYHIYCMSPPRYTIPRGKWYCVKCERELKHLRKVKRAYEKMENTLKIRDVGVGKGDYNNLNEVRSEKNILNKVEERREDVLDKSGGVDMVEIEEKSENSLGKSGGVDMVEIEEKSENSLGKSGGVDMVEIEEKSENSLGKSGGVDMLLTAAKTLSRKENMVALRKKRLIQLG